MSEFDRFNEQLDPAQRLSPEQLAALEERISLIKGIVRALPGRLSNGDTTLPSLWREMINTQSCDDNVKSAMEKGSRKATLMQWGDANVGVAAEARFADQFLESLGAYVTSTSGETTPLSMRTLPIVVTDPSMLRLKRDDWSYEAFDGSALLMSDEFDWPKLLIAQTAIHGVQLTMNGSAVSRPELTEHQELLPELEVLVR